MPHDFQFHFLARLIRAENARGLARVPERPSADLSDHVAVLKPDVLVLGRTNNQQTVFNPEILAHGGRQFRDLQSVQTPGHVGEREGSGGSAAHAHDPARRTAVIIHVDFHVHIAATETVRQPPGPILGPLAEAPRRRQASAADQICPGFRLDLRHKIAAATSVSDSDFTPRLGFRQHVAKFFVGLLTAWAGEGFFIDRDQQVFRPQSGLFGRASGRHRQDVQSLDRAVGPIAQAYAQARALRTLLQGHDFLAHHVGELLFRQITVVRVGLQPHWGKHQSQHWR